MKYTYALILILTAYATIAFWQNGYTGEAIFIVVTMIVLHILIGIFAILHAGSKADDMMDDYFANHQSENQKS